MHKLSEDHKDFLPDRTLFAVRDLSFSYPDGRPALERIDLSIQAGDRLALVGQNGSGKTTLIKHLAGLLTGGSGTITYKGRPLTGEHLRRARLEIGVLFQDPDDQLFCSTLFEDVCFGPLNQGLSLAQASERAHEVLATVGLADLVYKAPHDLSYGQRKRAALATVFAMQPQVLILDEPTANLDPRQEEIIGELLESFTGTLICISHDLAFLQRLCSRALVLDQGRVHHDFTMAELIAARQHLLEHGLDFTYHFTCCRDDAANGHMHPHVHIQRPLPAVPDKRECFIYLADYSYRYPDSTRALNSISLAVRDRERVALIGENGAGKSTLLACLMGIRSGKGGYLLNGLSIESRQKRELFRHIGMVFQNSDDQLFCPTCRQEVAFGPRQLGLDDQEVNGRVQEALAAMRLTGYEERVPHRLSGGERKRLAIAAVLSMRPQMLILDEPTAGLDYESEKDLTRILQNLSETLVVVSHDLRFLAALAQRAIVMHKGEIISDCGMADFLQDASLVSINGINYRFQNICEQHDLPS